MKKCYKQVNATGTYWYADPNCTILHCADGPAIEHTDGSKAWFINGELQRLDCLTAQQISRYDELPIKHDLNHDDCTCDYATAWYDHS